MRSKRPPADVRWYLLLVVLLWVLAAWLWPSKAFGQYMPAAGVAAPPPSSQPVVRTDTTTLAAAVWKGRSSFNGEPGVRYVVPKGWGPYGGSGFDCNLNGATIAFTSTPGDRLINFASTSRGFTIRNGFIDLGPPEAKRGLARVGGSFQTFSNLVIVGGSDVFNTNGDGSRAITLDHVWQSTPYRGNWFYSGDDSAACVHEDWVFKHVYVPVPLREDLGLSHVLRLYDLKNGYFADCVFENPQTTNTVGAGVRVHSTKGGFTTFERCTFGGYENRLGPLLLHPDDDRVVENVTFRNCLLRNRWHITNGASLLFDGCAFEGATERPLSATDPGACFDDANRNGKWDKGEAVTRPWPTIRLTNCTMRSTTPSGVFVDAVDRTRIAIDGGRGINPSKGYDGPLKFAVP